MALERACICTVDEVMELLTEASKPKKYTIFKGYNVKSSSDRYQNFIVKGITCVTCGLTASYFAIERGDRDTNYHFNLYGTDKKGREVLFTKDHILPKSKGGKNHIDNYQTMCTRCNAKKGNKIPKD